MIVLDASAVLDGLLDPLGHSEIAALISGAGEPLSAPELLDVEVLSVLRRWERRREPTSERARQALDDLQVLPVIRYCGRIVIDRAWELRHNLSAYDAQYVALAQAVSAPLLTTDDRLAHAASSAGVSVVGIAS